MKPISKTFLLLNILGMFALNAVNLKQIAVFKSTNYLDSNYEGLEVVAKKIFNGNVLIDFSNKGYSDTYNSKRGQFLVLICKAERGQGAIFDFGCASSLWPELG